MSFDAPLETDLKKIYLMLGPACNLKCRHCYETDVPQPRLKKDNRPGCVELPGKDVGRPGKARGLSHATHVLGW